MLEGLSPVGGSGWYQINFGSPAPNTSNPAPSSSPSPSPNGETNMPTNNTTTSNPDLLNQLIAAMNSNAGGDGMTAAPTGQAGLRSFFDSPMYQVMFGENNDQIDPHQRFRADPGYQFAQDEAMRMLQQRGAAKGLLESGPMQIELMRQSQGMADQNYQRWLGQQQGLFGSYQNQLAQLTGLGSQNTGADQASQIGMMLAPLLGGYNFQTGQLIGGANLSTGGDIANLLANLGSAEASMIMNTASAIAGNQMNGWAAGQQIASNNAYSNVIANNNANLGGGGMNYGGWSNGTGGTYGPVHPNGSQSYTGGWNF